MSTRGLRSIHARLLAGVCLAAAACDPGAPALTGEGTAAPFQGELVGMVATFDDGHAETTYSLRISETDEPALLFATAPDVAAGEHIGVWGERHVNEITVYAYGRLVPTDESPRQSELVGAEPKPPRKFAFVLVDTGGGVSLTTAQAQSLIFKGTGAVDTSLARYYLEESYGVQTLTGDIIGPLKFAMGGCNTGQMSMTLRAMIPQTYQQYGWYFNRTNACGWSGLASVGLPTRPARDTWFNGSSGCVVLAQEPGHNFGMTHSSTIRCQGGVPLADVPNGKCTHSEYGDPFDPMGHGCYHMTMYQKAYQGWVQGCNSVLVPSSGTFDIFPMELACNAIQTLQVPMPKMRPFLRPAAGGGNGGTTNLAYYYIEYRQPVGIFEKPLGNVFQGVLIHAGEQYRTLTQGGRYPYLLDMTPETTTFNDAALVVGKTFTDPAGGVSITLVSADTTKATVKIDIMGGTGMPTCMDGTTISAPGPQSCGQGGGIIGADGGVLPPLPTDGGLSGTGGADGSAAGGDGRGGGGDTLVGTGGSGEPGTQTNDAALPSSDAGLVPPAATGDGSTVPAPSKVANDAFTGCACTVTDQPQGAASALALLLLGLLAIRRRRAA
jgi:MYXO-CTERM domain-containing protein